ncbi:relaxase/mobilization nuclease domain-containing protein [Salmonella enterica subsp. enterica serovar Enteritidis]|nr:relaxase/mobilization nuclease domain-containing protein [Salmonella enterica subsp. enterica serovar Enteritidis]
MIAKHVPMRTLGKSNFGELARYITDAQSKDHRLGQVRVTNCEAATLPAAIEEVLATQHMNTRAKSDKTYHLLVSFRAGEQPDDETLKAIEERICAGLGYGEHQRVSAVHNDTDNLHIHIAINKIHPTRNTMHEPFQAYRTLGALCEVMEKEYGLEQDNHEPRRKLSEGRAADMERHAGIESLVGWIKRECLEEIRGATSWADLHQVMRDNGLELRERGNGLVVEASDGTMVKASTLARDLSKPALEGRLGPFEASAERKADKPKRSYQKAPVRMRIDTTELYARYKDEQKNLTAARAEALDKARRRKDRAVEDAKRANRLRRATIKVVDSKGVSKKMLYSQASAALRSSLDAIHAEYKKEREKLYQGFQRRTWADWLKSEAMQGNPQALAALRARDAAKGLQGHTLTGQGEARGSTSQEIDNITKKGTIIYRAGQTAVRDDGDKLQVSRENDQRGLQAALRMAAERYGSRITVTGNAEFKARIIHAAVDGRLSITFADPGLERRRQELLTQKEQANVRTDRANQRHERGRSDRRGTGRAGSGAVTNNGTARAGAGRAAPGGDGRLAAGSGLAGKPDVGRVGRNPPPQSQHRLRTLSALGLVQLAGRSEVLLPRDVSRHLEQQGTQPDNQLRRNLFGPGVKPEAAAAAEKYISERESKRAKGFDIPKHSRYTDGAGGLSFAGVRNVDGQTLALLKRDETVMVLPIDQATARRLSRIAVGDPVSVTPRGSIKTSKGRSR